MHCFGNAALPPIQERELRQAFYSGMLASMAIIKDISDGITDEDAALRRIDQLADELQFFLKPKNKG